MQTGAHPLLCFAVLFPAAMHPAGRLLSSDWPVNSFIMIAYEKFVAHPLDRKF